jgi:hypothetical protein
MAARFVLAIAADRQSGAGATARPAGRGCGSRRPRPSRCLYFRAKAFQCAGSPDACAAWPSFIVSADGARLGYQTSYQFCEANSVFGTPRGGRRTVPMRRPSPGSARSCPVERCGCSWTGPPSCQFSCVCRDPVGGLRAACRPLEGGWRSDAKCAKTGGESGADDTAIASPDRDGCRARPRAARQSCRRARRCWACRCRRRAPRPDAGCSRTGCGGPA